ncbi:MAG: hypothetical protein CVU90_14250 [Firmicutes bacterium HGW-Firmicutes-15]|nr:MAG: hypothetical protein CVU90_14250 [Firmicutes bacterium HGW-Firmicutes-15]
MGIEGKISNLLKAITEGGGAVHSIVEKIKSLEIEKAAVEARLHEFNLRQKQDLITEDKIINYLFHYQNDLLGADPTVCKRVAEEFVESVVVKKDTIEITFKVSVVSNGGDGAYRVETTIKL